LAARAGGETDGGIRRRDSAQARRRHRRSQRRTEAPWIRFPCSPGGALISRRTKDALAAAKARGVIIGGPRGKGRKLQAEALQRGEGLREVFAELTGLSLRGIAKGLNARSIPTANGRPWS
jgi:hypothetical protein